VPKSTPKPKVLRKVRVRRVVPPPTPGTPAVLELEIHDPPPLPADPVPSEPIEFIDYGIPFDTDSIVVDKKQSWGAWLVAALFGGSK
jgi:hypothetical protein